jgi:hypothetical protein
MKNQSFYSFFLLLAVVSCFSLFSQPVKAEVSGNNNYFHVITLATGWNVLSVPRLVANHQFSAAETNTNFDIFLLDNTKPSGWATMADLNQPEFTPLFGYFINNKTGSVQTLTVNYKKIFNPSEGLFNRTMTVGWNVIGVADPDGALRQKENNSVYLNNIPSVLSSFTDNIDSVLDFTADQVDKSSVKIGDSWGYKTSNNLNELSDFRETKAYAVYVKTAGTYHGYQNNDAVKIFDLVNFFDLKSGATTANEKTNNVDLVDFSVYTGYPIDFSLSGVSVELWSYGVKNAEVSNLKLSCNGGEKIKVGAPLMGLNYITASSSLPAGVSQCKLTVDLGAIDNNDHIQATIRGLDNLNNWKIQGNSIRFASIPSEIKGYWVEVDKLVPTTISLAKTEAASNKVSKNQDNAELGTIKIIPISSRNLELKTLKLSIAFSGATTTLSNLKITDKATGNNYGLTYSGVSKKYQNTSLTLALPSGVTKELVVSANVGNSAAEGDTIYISMANSVSDLEIYEVDSNTRVVDVTPNSVTFNFVTVQRPTVAFSVNPLSNPLSSVVGATNVTALDFNVKASQAGNLKIQELDFLATTTANGGVMSSIVVSNYKLYKNGVSTPIKSVSGSSVSSGTIAFSGLSEIVPANITNEYYVAVDLVNDGANLPGQRLQLGLKGYSIVDFGNNNIYDAINDVASAGLLSMKSVRKIAIVGAGSLWVSMDNTDANTLKNQFVVAGNTTPYLAAIKMRAMDEDIKIVDLSVNVGNSNAANMFSSLSITDSSGNIIGTTYNVTASTTFSGINLTVPQATQTYYVKGVLNPIGRNQVGISQAVATFSLYGINAKGVSSNSSLTAATTTAATCNSQKVCYVVNAGNDKKTTITSKYVEAVASRISSVELVSSGPGCALSSYLNSGNATVAIIKVTTDNTGLNRLQNGDVVKTVLNTIKIDFTETNIFNLIFTIKKCGGIDAVAVTGATIANGSASSTSFALGSATNMPNDNQISSQSTSYYEVVANITTPFPYSSSLQVDLNHLDGGPFANFFWRDSSDSNTDITSLLLSNSSVAGVRIIY